MIKYFSKIQKITWGIIISFARTSGFDFENNLIASSKYNALLFPAAYSFILFYVIVRNGYVTVLSK